MTTKVKNLTQGLLDEMDRVKKIKAEYDKLPTGKFAAAFMAADLEAAKQAVGEGDAIAMIRCYEKLKEYQL